MPLIYYNIAEPTRYELPDGTFVLSVTESDSDSEEDISGVPSMVRKPDIDLDSSYTDLEDTGRIVSYVEGEYVDKQTAKSIRRISNPEIRILGRSFIGRCDKACEASCCSKEVEATFAKVDALLQKSDAKNAFKD